MKILLKNNEVQKTVRYFWLIRVMRSYPSADGVIGY